MKAGFALLGYHLGAGRAQIELLGRPRPGERTGDDDHRDSVAGLSGVPSYRGEYTTSAHHAVAVVGADAAVSLTTRAALVPQVRVYALNGALQVRPGLGLRWTF